MKVVLISLLFTCSLCCLAQTRLKFERMDPLPRGVYAFGYAGSDQEIYAISGSRDRQAFSENMFAYNGKVEEWIEISVEGLPAVKYVSAVYLKKHKGVLLAGGLEEYGSNIAFSTEIRMIYKDGFRIRSLGPVPEPAKNLGLAHYNDKIYMFGGGKTVRTNSLGTRMFTFSDKVFEYDLSNGKVEELTPLPKGMETKGGIVNDQLYTFGGFDGQPLMNVWQYDLKEKTWSELTPLERPLSAYAIIQYEHYFLLIGDFHKRDQLILYNTKTQTAQYFKMNFGGRDMGAAILGDYLHVYGGTSPVPRVGVQRAHFRIALKEIIK